MSKRNHIAVVTGGSSGIGFETSLCLARNGYYTYATVRDTNKAKKIEKIAQEENLTLETIEMDVNSDDSVKKAIDSIISKEQQIDLLVNNAGYGLFGALEELTIEEIKKQFETNVFGVIRVIQNVIPIMRYNKKGIIVNVTSLAGLMGVPAESVYASTKFAIEGLSESLSFEVENHGIKIILIEPGVIKTDFVQNIVLPDRYNEQKYHNHIQSDIEFDDHKTIDKTNDTNETIYPYKDSVEKFLKYYFPAMNNAPSPRLVANELLMAIKKISEKDYKSSLLRVPVGNDSIKYSKLKKEMSDNQFHELLKRNIMK